MKALFAGSFDPPHLGHLDLVRRASALVQTLIVAVAVNPEKPGHLAVDERVRLLRSACRGLSNVEICSFSGATVAFARARSATTLLRGVRNGRDLDSEQAMAEVNRGHGLDTLLLMTASPLLHVSSSLVRNVLAAGLPLDGLVDTDTAAALRRA